METRSLTVFALILSAAIMIAGCGSLSLDEGNLEKVANHYYQPGQKKELSMEKKYAFLSEKSKAQVTKEEWVKRSDGNDNNDVVSLKVLGEKETSGNKYAVVSATYQFPGGDGKSIISYTWILESGKWRRLSLPKTQEETEKAMHAGDYAAAKAKAEEWLSIDPFSVRAFKTLGFALGRSGGQFFKRGDRSLDDIVRALLAINPEDTDVLFFAATWSETSSIAKSYLKKMEGTSLYSSAAFNVALKIQNPKERLGFLERMTIGPELAMLKMESQAALSLWDEFRQSAKTEGEYEQIKQHLDAKDASYAAGWSGSLGLLFHKAKDDETARKWLDYGITRDPNNRSVQRLARILDR